MKIPHNNTKNRMTTLSVTMLLLQLSIRTTNAVFVEKAKVTANDLDASSTQAYGLSCALQENTLMVGSPADNSDSDESIVNVGSVYVYQKNATDDDDNWILKQKLTADAGIAEDRFGFAICLQDELAIIAGTRCGGDTDANGPGCFYVYTRDDAGIWTKQGDIVQPTDGQAGDGFGASCAMENDTLVIGSPGHDNENGAVYAYTKNSSSTTSWDLQAKLQGDKDGNEFGDKVALSGDTLVVGHSFTVRERVKNVAAYVFVRSTEGIWSQQAKLQASGWQKKAYNFGQSVAIHGDTIAVGSSGRVLMTLFRGSYSTGSVTIFTRSGTTWTEQQVIKPFHIFRLFGSNFGDVVALYGDTLAVGASTYQNGIFRNWQQGAMYIYKRQGGDKLFEEESKILTSDGRGASFFGLLDTTNQHSFPRVISFDVSDGKSLCAASEFVPLDGRARAGSAYVFEDE